MFDFSAEIKPFHSLGDVLLNTNISVYLAEMYADHCVEYKEYLLPDASKRFSYVLDDTLTISTEPDGNIFSIGCNQNYTGLYKNLLYAGQEFGEIKKLTCRQRIFNGSIIIDEDFGIQFILPSPFDEIADSIDNIPSDLKLNEIYIGDFSFWNPCK
ncbi:hypothetical protein [Klebsiella aerogenes]|uniref:hypothetical protein n=1 Tax=Klebsiella aerogenes TaxID=548 RepID=UPI0014952165|nr:hypothetical protein [Klebsiella aerogenes]EIW8578893.1 hypothetical protein [Klebsiella aerogenes]NPE01897.1 hypothetical protein [Klebsiella aerogenes]HEI8896213.1 hypothetical protein [Klebsiella aerogenes]